MDGDVHRARHKAVRALGFAPHVQHHHVLAATTAGGEVGEGGAREGPRLHSPGTQSRGPPVAAATGRSMPTRASSRCAAAICSGVSASSVTGLPHGISQAR